MPIIDIEFEVYCSCGEELCSQTTTGRNSKGYPYFDIEPCEKCLKKAEDEGYKKSYEEGYEEGLNKNTNQP